MSEPFAFTAADVVAQVRALAAERPAYIYQAESEEDGSAQCSYVTGRDGQGCIVGQALARLGVPPERLREFDDMIPGGTSASEVLKRLLPGKGVVHTPEVLWVALVQSYQDEQRPWGQAVERADLDRKVTP